MNSVVKQIWDDFSDQLKGFIFKKVKDEDAANDILQDVFLKIMEHSDKVAQAQNIQQYIYGIARNSTIDFFRKQSNTSDYSDTTAIFTEEEDTTLNTTIADCCVKPFIAQLPEKYRYALVRSELEHISQKELAKELDISYSGAKSRVQRGKEKLKALIMGCCNMPSDTYGNLQASTSNNCGCD